MKIAVIIASRNRPQNIELCLRSILTQNEPPHRVIVVDQSVPPYDLQGFPTVVHVHDTSLSGLTAARNAGLKYLEDAEVVFFADDDIEMEQGCLAAVRRGFEADEAVIGLQCLDKLAHEEGRLTAVLRKVFEHGFFRKEPWQRNGRVELPVLEGFGMAFRTRVFATERFDERLQGYSFGEDWEFSHRARRYGILAVAEGGFVRHHRSPLNRHDIHAHLRDRWTHYAYFYRKLDARTEPLNQAWRAWWTIGESYKWLRHGMGLPKGVALDRRSTAPEQAPVSGVNEEDGIDR